MIIDWIYEKRNFYLWWYNMHIKTLPKETKNLFEKIAKTDMLSEYHFIWWTALALYLWHRESIDLDFVTYSKVSDTKKRTFKSIDSWYEILYESNEQIDLFIQNVKVTLLSYRRKPLFPLQTYKNIKIRDIRDIAISKANTIWRRSEIKDYIDLYCLLSEKHITIQDLMEWSQKKFWWDFSPKLFLKHLLLVNNCEDYDIPILWWRNINKKIMNDYFSDLVKKIVIE